MKRYIYFHGTRHPADLDREEVEVLLTSLAVKWPNAAKFWGWQ